MAECLVFALDNRLWARRASNPRNDDPMRLRVESLTQSGLTLVAPLYRALADFESGPTSPSTATSPFCFAGLPEYQEEGGAK